MDLDVSRSFRSAGARSEACYAQDLKNLITLFRWSRSIVQTGEREILAFALLEKPV